MKTVIRILIAVAITALILFAPSYAVPIKNPMNGHSGPTVHGYSYNPTTFVKDTTYGPVFYPVEPHPFNQYRLEFGREVTNTGCLILFIELRRYNDLGQYRVSFRQVYYRSC